MGEPGQRKGQRALLSKALGCQPTFVTQVLNKDFNFSLEQAERLNRFLDHNEEESEYLFLLVQKERAGSRELAAYFDQKIKKLKSQRQILSHRLGKETTLSKEQQGIYYSSWYYAAIHIATAIPELQTKEKLANYFQMTQKKVSEVLDYLTSVGLVVQEAGRYSIGTAKIRLGNDSPNILRHHANWRQKATEFLEREGPNDLHYSGVLCLTPKDQEKIKSRILDMLKEHLQISDEAKEEDLCCYNIDLFSLKRDT